MSKIYTLLILTIFALACQPKVEQQQKPNVIVILTDDQGWGDLSHSGNTNLQTPNIDTIAQNGASFERFFVSPVCSPTRAEMLTGRYSVRGGVYSTSAGGERLDLDEQTIGDVFKEAGYATAAYGKWHNGMQAGYHPNARGFDDYYGFCSGHWGNYFDPMLEHNGEIVKGKGFLPDDLTDHAISFVETNKDKPFFLYIPYNTPHSPMQVPDKFWNKQVDNKLEMYNRNPEKEDTVFTKAALAMCENLDWNVGRLTTKLEELNLTENTIIVYFSDNGPNGVRWNGGMKGRKGSTDEGGVRVPMFVQWKGVIDKGQSIPQISTAMDLLPTLTDLAGISWTPTNALDGTSLKPLLTGNDTGWQERYIVNYWRGKASVRGQRYRLDAEGRLFDMVNDPGQLEDISATKPEVTEEMSIFLDNWKAEVLTELPEKDERTFAIGHPDQIWTQIPARDGTAHGNVKRSNRYPNNTFFTNWISTEDRITWEVDVMTEGDYEVEMYYTCSEEAVNSVIALSIGDEQQSIKMTEVHDPPLTGDENDRHLRMESYVKDFKATTMGTVHLMEGAGTLELKALEIPGKETIDFRLIMLKRK